jgi:dTDP-4-dehydrorhamnose reductase
MKILLLGANGQVGFELARTLAPLGDVICATRNGVRETGSLCMRADLADVASLETALRETAAHVIVNAAAYTAVDRAEDEENIAVSINHEALKIIGAHAAQTQALVVHYSTDYVFDGRGNRPYRENDNVAPLGVYGRSKLAGEIALQESGCANLILRTAWVYGARGQNFLRTMLRVGRERDQLRVVNDQRGAPTTARLIAETTAQMLGRWMWSDSERRQSALGIYNLCASGSCTWHEFASAIFQRAHAAGLIDRTPQVVAIATSEYPTKARRPAYSVLDTTKLRTAFDLYLPAWEDGLDAVLGELVTQQTA